MRMNWMKEIILNFVQIFVGFSGGIVVGGGFVAFITVLRIIPRLIQLSGTEKWIKVYIAMIISGLVFGTYLSFFDIVWNLPLYILVIWGLFHGIFIGMLAAALAEILNVIPILLKRVKIERFLLWLLMAVMFGKVVGSLFQWVFFVTI